MINITTVSFINNFFPGCNEAFYILYLSLKSVGNQEYKT